MNHQHPAGKAFVKKRKHMVDQARAKIRKSQEAAAKYYNKSRTDVAYTVGARVLLSSKSLTAPTHRDLEVKAVFLWAFRYR